MLTLQMQAIIRNWNKTLNMEDLMQYKFPKFLTITYILLTIVLAILSQIFVDLIKQE